MTTNRERIHRVIGKREARIERCVDAALEIVEVDGTDGVCTVCEDIVGGIEPDAEAVRCEGCGAHAVWGAENLIITFGGYA